VSERAEEKRTYNEKRHGYDVEGPCWQCNADIRYFVDEDGTPRDIMPVYDDDRAATDAAMNYGDGMIEGRKIALRELKIDLHNASIIPVAGKPAVLLADIDDILDTAIRGNA